MLKGADKLKAAVSFTIPPLKLCTENYNSVRVTGLEPVKSNTPKPCNCKEHCNHGTCSAYHFTSLCYKIPFRVAFYTTMQHGNATRKDKRANRMAADFGCHFILFSLL